VSIDENTIVIDVIDQMMLKTHAKSDPSWAIVEHISKHQLGIAILTDTFSFIIDAKPINLVYWQFGINDK